MSITSEANRTAELATDGVETEFDFSLLIHAESELQVWYKVTGGDYAQLVLNTDYTVEFGIAGGTITTIGGSSPYAAGSILIIRHLPITQQTNWLYNDNHTEQTHQDDFDRTVMRDLQIQEQLDRAVGFAITSSTVDIEFPEPLADKVIGWNSTGTELENKTPESTISSGIADGNFLVVDGSPNSGEYARFTSDGLEGRTESEFKADYNLEIGTDVLAQQTIGIADNNLLEVDGTPNDDEYAKFTANGLEGRTVTENRDDLGLGTGDSPVWTGATLSGLTAGRVLFAGASGVISDDAGLTYASATDILTAGTYNATDEDNALQIDGTTILKTGSTTSNIFIGENAGGSGTGGNNVAVGSGALINLTTGQGNFALGGVALNELTTQNQNVAIGFKAGQAITSNSNMVIGANSGLGLTFGAENVFIGVDSGKSTKFGSENVAIGKGSMQGSGTARIDRNVGIGGLSLNKLTTGDGNVAIGYKSGFNQTTNSNLLIIDNQDRGSIATELTNCMIYGVYHATVTSQTLRFNVGDLSIVSGTPYQYLINNTHEDSDGGRESRINFKGEQSGGELTTLARIEVGHDGAADDEKGKIVLYVNDGNDGDSPTQVLEIGSDLLSSFVGNMMLTGAPNDPTFYFQSINTGIWFDNSENQLKFAVGGFTDRLTIDGVSGNVGIGNITPTLLFDVNAKSGMTPIGGYAIKLTNKTGANSIAGELVNAHTSVENAVEQSAINDAIPIGAFLDSGIADGSEAWVVVGGIAQVLIDGSTTVAVGDWVKVSSNDAGRCEGSGSEAPGLNHFREIGHSLEGGGNNELIKIAMHFN